MPRNGPSGWYSKAWMSRCRPVVEQHHPEHVRVDVVDRDPFSAPARRADHDGELELDVELRARLPLHPAGGGDVALRSHDLGARHRDRAGPAVIADGDVAPVGEQRLTFGAEQATEVRRVVDARVHVDVVADRHGHAASRARAGRRSRRDRARRSRTPRRTRARRATPAVPSARKSLRSGRQNTSAGTPASTCAVSACRSIA